MQSTSPKYSLNKVDLKEIGISFLALLGACVFVFLLSIVTQIDFGQYSAILVLVVTPMLHTGIKWIKENDTNLPDKALIDAVASQADVGTNTGTN